MTNNILKGDDFLNRYRIEGTLTTISPFHLGSGSEVVRNGLLNEKKDNEKKNNEPVKISAIATDYRERPTIPGSSLKGALRGYLLNVFSAFQKTGSELFAYDWDYVELINVQEELQKQDAQIQFMKEKASILERIFGTPFAEGKIEIWDSACVTTEFELHSSIQNPEAPPFWNHERLTYVDQSIAINPETRTTIPQKLYHFEVIPPGISFKVIISGQNLTEIELGMLLFGLYGFNSQIWHMTLGAMAGRGFGRFNFALDKICYLEKDNMGDWIKNALEEEHSGYFSLNELDEDERKKRIEIFKKAFSDGMGG